MVLVNIHAIVKWMSAQKVSLGQNKHNTVKPEKFGGNLISVYLVVMLRYLN